MNEGRSLFLDVARFLAAAAVVLHHAFAPEYFQHTVYINAWLAVMIFFVISGFVIAYVGDSSERDWKTFAMSRATRIYIVAIPALLLTLACDAVGIKTDPRWYVMNDHEHLFARMAISLAFLNQVWNFTVTPLSNGPYWSLAYEVWYYVAFGIWMFVERKTTRIVVTLIVAALVGPRIAIMMSVWLVGVLAYRLTKHLRISSGRVMWSCFTVALMHFIFVLANGSPLRELSLALGRSLGGDGDYLLLFGAPVFVANARYFLDDLYVGCSFAAVLLFAGHFDRLLQGVPRVKAGIRMTAQHTFSLYLYHAPLLALFAAMTHHLAADTTNWGLLLLLTLGAVFVLSQVTEQRRPAVRRWLSRRLNLPPHDRRPGGVCVR